MRNDCILNLRSLQQTLAALDDESYATPLEVLFQASVGQHVRHVLEFYQCLLTGLRGGTVNYDLRQRDLRMERETGYAQVVIEQIIQHIQQLTSDAVIQLEGDAGVEDEKPFSIVSNVQRELAYNLEHSIHHQALIKIGLHALGRIDLIDASFGVAPSTMRNASPLNTSS